MKKKTIFFDLDDTLYDRFIPYQKAFRQFFGDRYAEKAPQAFDAVIHRGYEVFAAAHTGKISMRQMHVYRHQTGLADVGIAVTEDEALGMQALYAAQQRQITLTDTMRQVLDFCKTHFAAVGVITNGGVASQQGKLQSLGISQWVKPELIFISDACGVMSVHLRRRFLFAGHRRCRRLRLEDRLAQPPRRQPRRPRAGLHGPHRAGASGGPARTGESRLLKLAESTNFE